jgi:hypothetical protein
VCEQSLSLVSFQDLSQDANELDRSQWEHRYHTVQVTSISAESNCRTLEASIRILVDIL